jgi:hypothetical protein
VLVAAMAGLAGATAAVHLTSYPGPPSEAQALAAAAIALPDRPHNTPGPPVDCDYWCPTEMGGDDVVAYDGPLDRTDHVRVVCDAPQDQVAARVDQAHARLAAAGWRVEPVTVQGDGVRYFAASGAGLRLLVTGQPAYDQITHPIELVVTKGSSRPAMVGDALGMLGGTLLGWLAMAWIAQRQRRQRLAIRAAIALSGLPALLFAVLALHGMGNLLVAYLFGGAFHDPNAVLLPGLPFVLFPPATVVAGAAALVALALAALPGENRWAGRIPA